MPEEVTLVVAEASVHEEATLAHEPPTGVELAAGDTLRVRLSYRIYDQPKPEELWAFRLTTTVDGDDEAVSERIHRDRKLVSDDVLSHVGIDLHFPEAGTFELDYKVFVELAHRDWGDKKQFRPISEAAESGTVTVTVH